MPDIIFPNNNEKEFIKVAERLETKEMFFIYPYKKNVLEHREKIKLLQSSTKIRLNLGLIANPLDIMKAKNVCSFIITESSEKDQYVLEKQKPSLIFNLEASERRDKTHYRTSGLNQVLCTLAYKNNITIGFSFSSLLNSKLKQRAILLGRMMQNIRLCRKYKVNTLFASFAKHPYEMRPEKDLQSFQRVLSKS